MVLSHSHLCLIVCACAYMRAYVCVLLLILLFLLFLFFIVYLSFRFRVNCTKCNQISLSPTLAHSLSLCVCCCVVCTYFTLWHSVFRFIFAPLRTDFQTKYWKNEWWNRKCVRAYVCVSRTSFFTLPLCVRRRCCCHLAADALKLYSIPKNRRFSSIDESYYCRCCCRVCFIIGDYVRRFVHA